MTVIPQVHPASGDRPRHRRLSRTVAATVVAASTGLALFSVAASAAPATGSDARQRQFAAAAAEFKVPQSVLLALAYQQTRWESHNGEPSTTGNYNVMGLTQVDPSELVSTEGGHQHGQGDGLPEPAAPAATTPAPKPQDSPALHTLDEAAALLGRPADQLRTDPAQSIRGGAALLAKYQRETGGSLGTGPETWYNAVVRFSQTAPAAGGNVFADRVFETVREGAARITVDGQAVSLAADAALTVDRPLQSRAATPGNLECPATVSCTGAWADDANYAVTNRPADGQKIQYIVIHDTEGSWDGTISTFKNPATEASAHYLVGAGGTHDGQVAQLVNTKNTAWHAGNKTFNMHSIGLEHEGYALGQNANKQPTWYTEQLYRSSAELTKFLAGKYGIPLDRQHIIGHDEIPKPIDSVPPMHWDPGTFWDWSHYMDLAGAPVRAAAGGSLLVGGKVTIAPPFDANNQPPVAETGPRPQNFVYLRQSPDGAAALINGGTTAASDVRAKAVAGSSYVVAAQQGDWTAIWYDGVQGWFHNPNGQSAAADNRRGQNVATPRAGVASIPLYGRAYPEQAAYAKYPGVTYNPTSHNPVPLNVSVPAGQKYTLLSDTPVKGDIFYDVNGVQAVVTGDDTYYPVRYGHRLGFLKSTDVDLTVATVPPAAGYTPVGPKRLMDTREGLGGSTRLGGAGTASLQVTGGNTGVPADATAVILNVTAVSPSQGGYVTVYPDGQPRPVASNLNFTVSQIVPNLVVVPVVNGKVNFFNAAGTVDLLADITGYYSPSGSSKFTSAGPARLLDTRSSGAVGPNSSVTLQVSGREGVPADATGVILNVTVTEPSTTGFLTVYPHGTSRPGVSNLNFTPGQTVPNLVMVPLVDGKVDFYNPAGTVQVIADITGYYSPGGSSKFTSAGPTRLLDTREGLGGSTRLGPDGVATLQVAGKAGLPDSGVTAVVLNVTSVNGSSPGYVTVYPDGTPRPEVSNLNFLANQVIPNLVVVPVVNGKVNFFNKAGTIDLIADITGYYTAG
ncbi:N-acetylmuramoyl-L-alanine amidase [Kitasatospora gansuensis]